MRESRSVETRILLQRNGKHHLTSTDMLPDLINFREEIYVKNASENLALISRHLRLTLMMLSFTC